MEEIDRFRGCLLGLAVGDALGTTLEFRPRGTFEKLTDMVGGGSFNLSPGQWTDDTSMALCLASSLLEKKKFDARDQMQRYLRWAREGYLSSTGSCFDIGGTVAAALVHFQETDEPYSGSTDPLAAGNGSIMRLAPVPMFYYPDEKAASYYSAESSRTTHGAVACIEACRLFGAAIFRALAGREREDVLFGDSESSFESPEIASIARGIYRHKIEGHIRGTGYVVESLEAALWCFLFSETFEEAVLKAANLGDDADTTAAVCGQLAGAFYGRPAIPERWLEKLSMRERIENLAERLYGF
jgi:ADP-ribosyl-[dinitrogen reductase] hydrolase